MLLFVVAVLSAAALMAQPESEDKGPRAVVGRPIHDFGVLERGDRPTHEFVVANTGEATLELFDARSSCGCTVIDFDEEIAPGQSGVVKIAVETEEQAGAFAVNVGLLTNDPSNPRINLTLKADLADRIRIEPGYVRFIASEGFREPMVSKQRIYAADGNPLRTIRAVSSYPFVSATVRDAVGDERLPSGPDAQWILEVALLPSAPLGTMNGEIVLEFDHPRRKTSKLPVFGAVQPVLISVPEILELGEVSIEEGLRGSFRVDNTGADPVQLVSVESTVPGLELEIDRESGEEGFRWYIVVGFAPDMRKGLIEGMVRIHSTSERRPVLEVAVRGSVR